MIKISVYLEDNLVTEFESAEAKDITIGRAPGCDIRLDETSISRLHALIRSQGEGWVLERKANFGAVLLNGQEVENAPLEGGEDITVGKFSLRVNIELPQAAATSQSIASVSAASFASEAGDGNTKQVSSGVNALFRFEPGIANVAEFLMEKELAVFGRGSNCDVVLTEKKSSRKHFEVRRQGLSFFLKDLNSANGTSVNGNSVTEAELVPGDVIAVGEAKIQFSVENSDFFAKQSQFLPVPAHLALPEAMAGALPSDPGAFAGDGGGIAPDQGPGQEPPPAELAKTDLVGRLNRWWFSIPKPQRMRYLAIVVVGLTVMGMLGSPDEEAPKAPPPKKDAKGQIARIYENLTPEKKRFVVDNYKELLLAHEKKDYQKMTDHSRNILTYLDEYNDTKSYEAIARKGLDQIEEERKRKILEEKQAVLRKEVLELEEKGRKVLERALADAKARPELDSLIQEIYAKDPNNSLAGRWKQQIKDKIEDEKREAEAARIKAEQRQKAEDALAAVQATFKAEKYIQAIDEAGKLADLGWSDEEWVGRVEKLKEEIRAKLSSVINPLLADAKVQRAEGGDLVKARELYKQVLNVDAANGDAKRGIEEVRGTLILRAKRFYAEAILAESLSDLVEAKEKYEKCLRVAPDDPNLPTEQDYRRRCQRKLVRFEAFTPEAPGKN